MSKKVNQAQKKIWHDLTHMWNLRFDSMETESKKAGTVGLEEQEGRKESSTFVNGYQGAVKHGGMFWCLTEE